MTSEIIVNDNMPLPQLLEPNPNDVVLCSYAPTLDAFLAAGVVRKIAMGHNIPVEFQPTDIAFPALTDRNHISIGDDKENIVLKALGAKSTLIFRRDDTSPKEPLPFRLWQRTFPFGIQTMAQAGKFCGVGDASRSLARMVWEFFNVDRIGFDKLPKLIDYVDDAVSGRFKYTDTAAVMEAVTSYPVDFVLFDKLLQACEERKRREALIAQGQGILRYKAKNGV
jgi:hypothetical protein